MLIGVLGVLLTLQASISKTITGTLMCSGKPYAGAEVQLQGEDVRTRDKRIQVSRVNYALQSNRYNDALQKRHAQTQSRSGISISANARQPLVLYHFNVVTSRLITSMPSFIASSIPPTSRSQFPVVTSPCSLVTYLQ
ncbi:hypothetical protein Q1695_006905 [Nippostrongylus brasiliensis]|nr:hypothetical protein Q1695_006905 [Nippostrongylus brasiliensis]